MKIEPKMIFDWPEMPPLPPPGQTTLIRAATSTSRPAARQELRAVLRQILAVWNGSLPEQLPLRETPRGPSWPGPLGGHGLDISLSYASDEGWIGLMRGGWVGVDVMSIQCVPEAEDVARHYLGRSALAAIQQASDPTLVFTLAWTELEARLKCLKQELNELPVNPAGETIPCTLQSWVLSNQRVVTVASSVSTHF